jgi:hypothetical protein
MHPGRPALRAVPREGEAIFEFRQECLENPIEVVGDIAVPETEHAIAEAGQLAVAFLVLPAFRVLTALELDDQALRMRVHSANSAGVWARRNDRARSVYAA